MWEIAVGAGLQVASGLLGYLIQNGADQEADEILRRIEAEYDNLTPAKLEEIAAQVLGPTNLAKIKTDPMYRNAQNQALSQLDEIARSGGLTLQDKAVLNDVRNTISRDTSARTNAVIENMHARGIAGSGAELALRAQANQDAANRESQAGMNTAANAQQRYFNSILQKGNMAGQLRNQDYTEAANAARAQDLIDQFNVTNSQNMGMYNNQVRQNNFNNQMSVLDRRYGVAQNQANRTRDRGQRQGEVVAGVGNALGGAFNGFGALGQTGGAAAPDYADFDVSPSAPMSYAPKQVQGQNVPQAPVAPKMKRPEDDEEPEFKFDWGAF
jgi:hypothetical protein